ncbi:hypothetical protein BJY04DRAFT_218021 [Aspergillus karnatakaensis]|uniref:uncharacterized protein n=1 Tax=Aspergillus karnatakaensis TaxID=1810916 RepID=UPI003CCE2BCD
MSKPDLAKIALETHGMIPTIAKMRPDAPLKGYLCLRDRYCPLSSRFFPNLSTKVKVVNDDTYDAAIKVAEQRTGSPGTKHVCVLNLANAHTPGGGWLNGALAQEEVLCYRSTLSETLKPQFYPMKPREAIYSPSVIIFRDSNYALWDTTQSSSFPVVSVVSMAAIRGPKVQGTPMGAKFADPHERELTKEKIRVILRVTVINGHRSVVLGALGCGVFGNPREDMADCFVEVLQEQEFRGWFNDVVFAVLGKGPQGIANFKTFHAKLDGLTV